MQPSEVVKALERYCSDDDRRPALQKPFRDGRHMVGTDGSACVRYRIPESENIDEWPEEVDGHPSSGKIFTCGTAEKKLVLPETVIGQLLDLFSNHWVKHVCNGQVRNPDDLEEYYCPCCRTRLYEKDRELFDADEYDQYADNHHGFALKMPDGVEMLLKGTHLSDFVHFKAIENAPTTMEAWLYQYDKRPYDGRLYARSGNWEFICILYRFDKYDSDSIWKSLASLKIDSQKGVDDGKQ